jgi:4-hydroxyproline epimerase
MGKQTIVRVIDSHTGGEPTRVVVGGAPELPGMTANDKRQSMRSEFDWFRRRLISEPRGSDILVGALPVPPSQPGCATGVIFFNNVGYLGMCGHGSIGLIATLAHLGDIEPGIHDIETPVGIVRAELHQSGDVSIRNIPSYRAAKNVRVYVDGFGTVIGDIAWGGNWFFLVDRHSETLSLDNLDRLTKFTTAIRRALVDGGISAPDGAEIDHIELCGPSAVSGVSGRNFVLCPGGAYDRSPCGTGTSARLACLYADGKLGDGEIWRQESICGSIFEGSIAVDGDSLIPTITGRAYITAHTALAFDEDDPFIGGIAP